MPCDRGTPPGPRPTDPPPHWALRRDITHNPIGGEAPPVKVPPYPLGLLGKSVRLGSTVKGQTLGWESWVMAGAMGLVHAIGFPRTRKLPILVSHPCRSDRVVERAAK